MPHSSEVRLLPANQNPAQPEYSRQEREFLLRLAHEGIVSSLEMRELPDIDAPQHLSEARGAFTTLYLHKKLRGCVGYPAATLPLYRTVVETARAAAFEDPRFTPVTLGEARELQISISVLSQLQPIAPDQPQSGRGQSAASAKVR